MAKKVKKHTELEETLFAYIGFLITTLNIYDHSMRMLFDRINEVYGWASGTFTKMDRNVLYKDMIDHLNKEFDWNFSLMSEEENEPETEEKEGENVTL